MVRYKELISSCWSCGRERKRRIRADQMTAVYFHCATCDVGWYVNPV